MPLVRPILPKVKAWLTENEFAVGSPTCFCLQTSCSSVVFVVTGADI
jgi:hypothetical protein